MVKLWNRQPRDRDGAKLGNALLTHRQFLKWCGLAVASMGVAGTGQLVTPPKTAFASPFYVWGSTTTSMYYFIEPDSAVVGWVATGVYDSVTGFNRGLFIDAGPIALQTRNSSGRVGIGTTSPGYLLDVNGTANLRGIAGSVGVYVDPSGRVGIGHFSPAYKFHIWDGGTNGYTGLGIEPGSSPAAPLDMFVNKDTNFRISMVNQDSGRGLQGIDMRVATWGQPNGYLKLLGNMLQYSETTYGDQVGAGGTPRLTIANGGNVGIGTTNPQTKLEVSGGTFVRGTYANPGGNTGALALSYDPSANVGNLSSVLFGSTYEPLQLDASVIQFRAGMGTVLEKMRLTIDGRLGIGTDTPDSQSLLHVAGNVKIDGTLTAMGGVNATAVYGP